MLDLAPADTGAQAKPLPLETYRAVWVVDRRATLIPWPNTEAFQTVQPYPCRCNSQKHQATRQAETALYALCFRNFLLAGPNDDDTDMALWQA